MAELRAKVEDIKKSLSEKSSARMVARTKNNSLKLEITREKFEEITADLLSRTEEMCNVVLNQVNMKWDDIDTILLAGGSTRMPMIQEMLKRISGKDMRVDLINPDECVAKGAAIQATIAKMSDTGEPVSQEIRDKLGNVEVRDITSHTLGVVTITKRDGKEMDIVTPMIKKGTTVPCEEKSTFGTYADHQRTVKIIIKEGESEDPEVAKTIQEASLDIISDLLADSPIEVTYSISVDGMLTVIARDVTNDRQISVEIEREGNLSAEELASATSHLKQISVEA